MNKDTVVVAAVTGVVGAVVGAAFARSFTSNTTTHEASSPAGSEEAELSTTSSSHGQAVYETQKAVSEYLQFHFGSHEAILPYKNGPHEALDFPKRTAEICINACREHGVPLDAALDVGCAVGRSTFELTRGFASAHGVDFSQAFVDAAARIGRDGSASYSCTDEGELTEDHVAVLPAGIDGNKATFAQGDACDLPGDLDGKFNCVHAANLLCRLPTPRAFLRRLKKLLKPGGLVVLVSPYSWLPQYTDKNKWMGGYIDSAAGVGVKSADRVSALLEGEGFECVGQEDTPFMIREHVRKYQWGISHATIWKLK